MVVDRRRAFFCPTKKQQPMGVKKGTAVDRYLTKGEFALSLHLLCVICPYNPTVGYLYFVPFSYTPFSPQCSLYANSFLLPERSSRRGHVELSSYCSRPTLPTCRCRPSL